MNIYDIAKLAGVSIATVSRVLNGNGPVSQATRKRVEEVLEQSGYTPRPKWQVWGAWIALAVFVAFLIMYYTNVFRGGV